ncbi:MAG: dihydrodipicolinate synthase family protein [Phycisphaerales bacterium]|nr:dihydrodipicolinate synthase family protein [Phycisphaerales bacterium]
MSYVPETRFHGVVVPMITPFLPEGQIDTPAIGRIVEHLLQTGAHGIFPLGTTGEAASIALRDRRVVVEATVAAVRGRATVYAGIGGNCFSESVQAARDYAATEGVHAVVAHMPSYYPLSDREIEAYFLRLADAVPLPLVLYNIPATTHHHLALSVIDRLRRHGNIVAIKDSANDAARLCQLLRLCGGRGGFPVLIGSSAHFASGLRAGAVGIVPSGSHIVGPQYRALFDAAMRDDWPEVERLQKETDAAVAPYLKGRSLGQGLAALKAMLEKKGLCGRTMLPPLQNHEDDGKLE